MYVVKALRLVGQFFSARQFVATSQCLCYANESYRVTTMSPKASSSSFPASFYKKGLSTLRTTCFDFAMRRRRTLTPKLRFDKCERFFSDFQ